MPAAERLIVEEGLSYPEDSAGRMMQREVVVAPAHWTVGQTIDFMRGQDDLPEEFYSIMIIDPARRVLGQVRLSRLLGQQRPVRLSEIMETTAQQIPASMDQEEVAVLFRRYALVSAAVIDDLGRLVGMITVDDVVDVIDEEAEEDLMALAGVSDVSIRSTLLETLQARFSWLMVNLLTAVAASIVIGLFEDTIQRIVALAVLMPIVASMGGNAGTQTVTVAVRALALRQLSRATIMGFVVRELSVGFINGLIFAVTAGLVSYFWFGDMSIALVMAVAMLANLVIAGVSGTAIPLTLSRFGVDPAVASSVFITTVTDVVGFLTFLGLAAYFLL
jgi:magnesium transporter